MTRRRLTGRNSFEAYAAATPCSDPPASPPADAQAAAIGPEMERRNTERLDQDMGFQERDALIQARWGLTLEALTAAWQRTLSPEGRARRRTHRGRMIQASTYLADAAATGDY